MLSTHQTERVKTCSRNTKLKRTHSLSDFTKKINKNPKKLKTLPYSYNYLREELGIEEEKEVNYTFEDYNIRNPEISAGSVIWELHCLGIREGIIKGGCSNIKVVG